MKWNGNLTMPSNGLGQIENLVTEKLSAVPAFNAAEAGRMIHNTTDGTFYLNNGTAWVSIATGGDATALQDEVDALEVSLGAFVNADGTFNAASLNALSNVTGATSLLNALSQLDAAVSGKDQLSELLDTTITTPAEDNFLVYDSTTSAWLNESVAAVKTKLSLNVGTDVQAYDAALAALSNVAGTGLIVQTAADTFVTRSIVESATTGLVITNADGVAGNPSIALEAGLDSIAGLTVASGDVIYATAADTFAAAAPGATSGVQAHNAVLDDVSALAVVAADQMIYGTGAGTFGYSAVTSTARTLLDDATVADMRTTLGVVAGGVGDVWVEKAGDAMTGDLNMGANFILSSGVPTLATHLTNKAYVDQNLAGLKWKNSVLVASDSNIAIATGGLLTVDGVGPLTAGDRVLLMGQTTASENGIYIVASGAWTRATDFDAVTPLDEVNSAAMFVEQGTTYAESGWTQTATVTTVDTDAMVFTQFNGAGGVVDGVGLVKTGNVLDINMGAGIAALPSDEVGIDLYAPSTGALILTTDGSADSTATGAQLYLQLAANLSQDATGLFVTAAGITETELNASVAGAGLLGGAGTALSVGVDDSSIEINADALRIKAAGVTNTMLATSTITVTSDTGTDAVALGETLTVSGTDAIDTAMAANTLTVSVKDASSAQKGVATFNTANFSVTAGDVTLNSSLDDLSNVAGADAAGNDSVLVKSGAGYVPKKMHYVIASASSTLHAINHGLGQQFCNVTVVDTATNEVLIPNSIVFEESGAGTDNANNLYVTLNEALAITVIVTGL